MLHILLTTILILVTILILYFLLISFDATGAPYLQTPTKSLEKVLKYIEIDENSIVYDLGCGNGKLLAFLYCKYPQATYIGVEKFILPYLIAKFNVHRVLNKGKNGHKELSKTITIKNADIRSFDYTNATHIFVFLSGPFMKKLYSTFKNTLKPGTVVISHMFSFDEMEPAQVIINENRKFFGNHFYIYRF